MSQLLMGITEGLQKKVKVKQTQQMQVAPMLVEGGCYGHPFTVTATGVRANDQYHLHTHALKVGGVAKRFCAVFELDELS